MVEREATKCQACLSELTEEVKAFSCPKCQTVLALGDPLCPTCGMKFKVKALKPKEPAKDDQFLMKLIEWGKGPGERPVQTPQEPAPLAAVQPAPPETGDERMRNLARLRESISDLMENRSQMLERMQKRIDDDKARLAEISSIGDKPEAAERVEAEIVALADEMADITMLQAHMNFLSDEIASLMESSDVSERTKERGLAAKALRKRLEVREREIEELRAKEEQLVKREEMVDRKVQGYAQKRRELDDAESSLQLRLAKLEEEREELERIRSVAAGASTEAEREDARARWAEEQAKLRDRLIGVRNKVIEGRPPSDETQAQIAQAENDLDSMIGALESEIGGLIAEKAELQKKISEALLMENDMRKLLKVLDQMLGELPEAAIERFSKSDEFTLYEKVLDRFKV
jgi:chromosome segregation ATPase